MWVDANSENHFLRAVTVDSGCVRTFRVAYMGNIWFVQTHRLQCKTQDLPKHKFPVHATQNVRNQLYTKTINEKP